MQQATKYHYDSALHVWVKRRKAKPDLCEICKLNSPRELANISGRYLRDITDWLYLCGGCHARLDNRARNIAAVNERRKIPADRVCSHCDKGITFINRQGYAEWRKINGRWYCWYCYRLTGIPQARTRAWRARQKMK